MLSATVRVLTDVPKFVCNVLFVNNDEMVELSDALLVKLDTVDAFWNSELVGMSVLEIGNPVV